MGREQHIDGILRALGEVRQAKGDGPLARFLRRLARGDARRLRAFHDLSGGALAEALREALARLPEAELAKLSTKLTERPEEALGALSDSSAVRHTLLTRACGRLLDTRPLEPGEKVDGRYEVAELVGVGGMGIVYRAIDTETSEVVAVKVLRAELTRDPACVRRFLESAQLGRTLHHAGVVRVLEVSAAGSVPYLTMEWVEGQTLRATLDEQGALHWREARPIVTGVLSALAYAHGMGVLHLDLKPENVLLPREDAPKLCDFDLARVVERTGGLSLLPGAGTPDYMSPEQRREGLVDRRSDVYSAGVMIYELLAGRLPGRYTPMLHTGFGAPLALSRAIEAALHDDSAKRPEDAGALLEAIGREEPLDPSSETPESANAGPPSEPVGKVLSEVVSDAHARARGFIAEQQGLTFVAVNNEIFSEYVNRKDGSILIWLPSDRFDMGSEEGEEDARPVHEVILQGHFLGKHPVTNAQYRAFCKATGHEAPMPSDPGWGYVDYFTEERFGGYPVVGVTWWDAVAYCTWAGLRLPTEAEWERAARWHIRRKPSARYPWGTAEPTERLATFGREAGGGRYTSPVTACPDGASSCGAFDMAGNVWQWCMDWYHPSYYAREREAWKNPRGPANGDEKVMRGGGWSNAPDLITVHYRDCEDPDRAFDDVGFRVARDSG